MRKHLILIITLTGIYSCSNQISEDTSSKSERELITAESAEKDSLVTFFIYGELAPANYLDDENSITENYGFKLKRIAGSDVDKNMVNQALTQNKDALAKMNEKYGKNWMVDFENKTKYKLAIPFNE